MTLALSGKSRHRQHLLLIAALLTVLVGGLGALSTQRGNAYAWSNTLNVIKVVEGGTATAADFSIHVKQGSEEVSGSPHAGSATGTHYGLEAGAYIVSETGGPAGYTATFSGVCNSTGMVNIVHDVLHTCTITNTFTATPTTGTLTVIKLTDNSQNTSAAAVSGDFQVSVKSGSTDVLGSPQAGSQTGSVYTLAAGDYAISESGPAGYSQSFSATCAGGVAHVTAGANVTCTLTNTANAASVLTHTVTVGKFISGAHADATNTGGASFNMMSSWTAANLNGGAPGTGTFALGPVGFNTPNAYEAVTSQMNAGASYSASETGIPSQASACGPDDKFYLAGYGSSTTSLAAAASGSLSMTAPTFTNIQANQFVAVVNAPCQPLTATFTVTVQKFLGPSAATTGSFGFTTTTIASNIPTCDDADGCTNSFTLSAATYGGTFMATTSAMASGSSYTVAETGIDGTCGTNDTYRLVGYRQGASAAAAASASLSQTASFANIQANGHVIVYNETCPTSQTVHVTKYVGSAIAGAGAFNFSTNNGSAGTLTLNLANAFAGSVSVATAGSFTLSETGIDGTCGTGDAFRLLGYTSGATLALALADTTPDATLSLSNITADAYVVVWNEACPVVAETGQITVRKIWNGNGGTSTGPNASFTTTGVGVTNFTLESDSPVNSSETFAGLAAGTFSFNEATMAGWTFASVVCTADASAALGSTFIYTSTAASVTLAAGANVTCVFTNQQDTAAPATTRNVSVIKVADGTGVTTTAGPFTGSVGAFGSFSASVGGPASLSVAVPINQSVTITEDPNALGYTTVGFASAAGGVCPTTPATYQANPASFVLAAGSTNVTVCVMNFKALAATLSATPITVIVPDFVVPNLIASTPTVVNVPSGPISSPVTGPVLGVVAPRPDVTNPPNVSAPAVVPPREIVAGVFAPAPLQVPAAPATGNALASSDGAQLWMLFGIIAIGAALWTLGFAANKRG